MIFGQIGNFGALLQRAHLACKLFSDKKWRAVADNGISLHDLLLRDWGADLPIRGGHGQSRQDPIIVTATDPETVAVTQMSTICGIARGRGAYWRTLARTPLGNEWPHIEQFKIETVELTSTEIITQTENYYFEVATMNALHKEGSAVGVTSYRDPCGLVFPYEIGWMHFDSSANNDQHFPGFGVALQYKAPCINCSIFIYDRGRADISDYVWDSVVKEEFDAAALDITSVHPDFIAWPDRPMKANILKRYYRVGDDARSASLLVMMASCGKFIKVRATWTRDHFLDRIANNFIESLFLLTASGGRRSIS